MAVKVDVNYAKTIECNRSLADTYSYCANLETSLPACFPGVERFELLEPQVYRWLFEKISYSGHELQLKLTTRFKKLEPSRIEMSPAGDPGPAQITGHWAFAGAGAGTSLEFKVLLQLDLPIPFFLKAVAGPVAQKELSRLFDRYLSNVGKALS